MSIRSALAGGGVALMLASGAIGLIGGYGANEVQDEIASAPAESPANCPGGWDDTSDVDAHTVVLSCLKDGWLVVLKDDRSFSHAYRDGSADFVYDPAGVPGWR